LTSSDIILILVGFIFPPLAAVLKRGCRADFIINCALTMLGYVPGVIHAWYLILKYPAIAD
ncbi:putative cation transport-related protein, partial [Dimargaris cristalligena]